MQANRIKKQKAVGLTLSVAIVIGICPRKANSGHFIVPDKMKFGRGLGTQIVFNKDHWHFLQSLVLQVDLKGDPKNGRIHTALLFPRSDSNAP
eukprot:1142609-Pelagomonas_calceolata.AAC.4